MGMEGGADGELGQCGSTYSSLGFMGEERVWQNDGVVTAR
jgi:hypothetical protein